MYGGGGGPSSVPLSGRGMGGPHAAPFMPGSGAVYGGAPPLPPPDAHGHGHGPGGGAGGWPGAGVGYGRGGSRGGGYGGRGGGGRGGWAAPAAAGYHGGAGGPGAPWTGRGGGGGGGAPLPPAAPDGLVPFPGMLASWDPSAGMGEVAVDVASPAVQRVQLATGIEAPPSLLARATSFINPAAAGAMGGALVGASVTFRLARNNATGALEAVDVDVVELPLMAGRGGPAGGVPPAGMGMWLPGGATGGMVGAPLPAMGMGLGLGAGFPMHGGGGGGGGGGMGMGLGLMQPLHPWPTGSGGDGSGDGSGGGR
jgi:hypothetical protein